MCQNGGLGDSHTNSTFKAVDLADGERFYPMQDFVKPILKAKDAGLKVTIHSGEDTPASYVIDTINNFPS